MNQGHASHHWHHQVGQHKAYLFSILDKHREPLGPFAGRLDTITVALQG
jgi:hypothetical protein